MILTETQVKELALKDVDPHIETMRKDAVILRRNYFGENLQDYLSRINDYEDDTQFKLRKKFAEDNQANMENLLRPLDNLFAAKGGSRKYRSKTKKVVDAEFLTDVRGGMSMPEFMKIIFKEQLMTNPGGLAFIELQPKEIDEDENPFISIKNIDSIKNYLLNGIVPEYVVFEPDELKGEKEEAESYLWIVDDRKIYRVKIMQGDTDDLARVVIIDDQPHGLEVVPGITFSPLDDTRRNVKISPIWKQMKKLDLISIDTSVKQIYQFLHGFPISWEYMTNCPTCNGTKLVAGELCPDCNGTGINSKKDVTKALRLKQPNSQADQIKIAPDVAGYVQPDLETWREQREEIEYKFDKTFFSLWGTSVEKSENETATARFIDVQPVDNKLNDFADIYEKGEERLTNLLGKTAHPETFDRSIISYGRRFLIETPDQIWKKYTNSRLSAPIHVLDLLLEQYYESEFRKNEEMLAYMIKQMKVEPFVHRTVSEVSGGLYSEDDKKQKLYYSEWVKTIGFNEFMNEEIDKLKSSLKEYADERSINTNPNE